MPKSNIYILYVLVLACAFFGFNPEWGYLSGSPWWSHLTFQFAHGNIFHLAANMLVVFLILFYRKDKWWLWPVCYAVASLCSLLISTPKPTVGLSGLLLAYYGIIFLKDGPRWKPLLQTIIFMVVSCLFASRMAIGLHFLCLIVGAMIGLVMDLRKDVSRKEKMYGN